VTESLARKGERASFIRIAKAERAMPTGPEGKPPRERDGLEELPPEGVAIRAPSTKRPFRAKGARTKGKGGRRRLGLVAVVVAGLTAAAVSAVLLTGDLTLRRIEISGTSTLAAQDVVAASGLVVGRPLLSADLGTAERNLRSWAPVASARARYVFPETVRIEIVERRPAAFALVEDGDTTLPVAIDAEGYAFAKAGPGELPELPIISGIRFDGWKPGMRLPDYLLPSVASIADLGRTDPALLSLISEVRVERTNWGEVELLLFPLHHAIPVRTGPRLDSSLLRSIVLVLDALDKGGVAPDVGELDFRSGTIVFRSKEGRSG